MKSAFFKNRPVEKDYDLAAACSWYVPGIRGFFSVLAWFLVGVLLSNLAAVPLVFAGFEMYCVQMVAYPLMFIPVFIAVRYQSVRNSSFDPGYKLDSSHFAPFGGIIMAVASVLATLGASIMLESVNSCLPEVSDSVKKAIESITDGPLWASLLITAIMAPLFEEWLCRGVVLRGLLNCQRKGHPEKRGYSPAFAIAASSLFFAVIHGNIWQGVSAFLLGCLMGYAYYRTGSLKLTMLMHCANNGFSVLLSHFGSAELKEADTLLDVMPTSTYLILFAIGAAAVAAFLILLTKTEASDRQGNCDLVQNFQ